MPAGISRRGVSERQRVVGLEWWWWWWRGAAAAVGMARMEIDQCAVTVHLAEAFEVSCSRLQPALFLIIA